MPSYLYWRGDKAKEQYDSICYGAVYQNLDVMNVEVYYQTLESRRCDPTWNVKDGPLCNATEAQVQTHVSLLKKAGFVFEYKTGTCDWDSYRVGTKPCHIFTVKAGDNSPIMARFLLHGIRWISNWNLCMKAFARLALSDKVDTSIPHHVFNCFLIAALAEARGGGHHIYSRFGWLRGLKQSEYEKLITDTNNNPSMENLIQAKLSGMELHTKMVEEIRKVGRTGGALYISTYDFPWLAEEGAYERYHKELLEAIEYDKAADFRDRNELLGALGIQQPVGVA